MKVFEQEPGSRNSRRVDSGRMGQNGKPLLVYRSVACDHGQLELRSFNNMHTIECRSCGQVWKDYDFIQPALNKSRPVEDITNV